MELDEKKIFISFIHFGASFCIIYIEKKSNANLVIRNGKKTESRKLCFKPV
jgi:hypothetical protein